MKKLYELPRGTLLRMSDDWGAPDAIFHRIDGMYSVCSIGDRVFHLHACTPMVEVNGRWEICDTTK